MKHHKEIIMSRTPIRNQRSKGIKVKYVLQIFLLLAVCFWLIYQVKHSHDKKKEFDESDAKVLINRGGHDAFIRLGRKDIRPEEEDTITKNEKHDEEAEEEEETTGIVDENKHEEDEEDKKVEDTDNENVEGGDDEIEVHGLENSEIDREEEFVDGEKGRDDDDENENDNEEKDSEDGQMESLEKGDHDGDDTGTHEAREEHYKADDASSAVTHDIQKETTEAENQNDENVDGHPENILEETYMGGEKREELEEVGEMALDEKHSNITIGEVKNNVVDGSENGSSLNTTEVSDDHLKTGNSSTEISTETNDQEILSEGKSLERSNLQSIDVDQTDNSTFVMDDNHFASNSPNPDATKDAESNTPTLKSAEMSNNTDSTTEMIDALDAEKSYADDGANESVESQNTENSEELQQDSIDVSDSSHSLEETHARLDPDTLPEIQTETENSEELQQDSIDVSDSSHSWEETHARLDPDTLPEIQTEGSNTEDTTSE